jgi:hypothetical protein
MPVMPANPMPCATRQGKNFGANGIAFVIPERLPEDPGNPGNALPKALPTGGDYFFHPMDRFVMSSRPVCILIGAFIAEVDQARAHMDSLSPPLPIPGLLCTLSPSA